jgi:hypothetical protein
MHFQGLLLWDDSGYIGLCSFESLLGAEGDLELSEICLESASDPEGDES